jgi:hypothetical protein
MARITADDALLTLQAMQQSPRFFVEEMLGDAIWSGQESIMNSVRDNFETCARSCHGIGKTYVGSRIALWFLNSFENSIVITTAPTFRQVEKMMWKEMRDAMNHSKVRLAGKMLKTPNLRVDEKWYAMGLSTKDPDMFQGYHAEYILVIADEASGIPEKIYDAIDGVTTSQNARILMLGNPTNPLGRFAKSFKDPTTGKIHISAWDTPNFSMNGIKNAEQLIELGNSGKLQTMPVPYPYLITPMWAYRRALQWGINSPMWQSRVEGIFPEDADDVLIPLWKVEAAMSEERRLTVTKDMNNRHTGLDVARFGSDKTVFATRFGFWFEPLITTQKQSTTDTFGRLKNMQMFPYYIDDIGVGGGVTDQAADAKIPSYGINVQHAAKDKETFANLKSELAWRVREIIDEIYLPYDEELLAQLSNIKFGYVNGRISVEQKDEVKKRTHGQSPDKADAVFLSFANYFVKSKKTGGTVITAGNYEQVLYKHNQNR